MGALIYVLAGLLAGVAGGMGLGGGTLLIPALTIFAGMDQRSAQGANLVCFIPTAAAALFTHIKNRALEKSLLPRLIIGGAAGAVLGASIAVRLDPGVLRRIFGGFLLLIAIYEFFRKKG